MTKKTLLISNAIKKNTKLRIHRFIVSWISFKSSYDIIFFFIKFSGKIRKRKKKYTLSNRTINSIYKKNYVESIICYNDCSLLFLIPNQIFFVQKLKSNVFLYLLFAVVLLEWMNSMSLSVCLIDWVCMYSATFNIFVFLLCYLSNSTNQNNIILFTIIMFATY